MKTRNLWGLFIVATSGCAMSTEDDSNSIAQVDQAVRGGTVTNKRGVVEISIFGAHTCTGVMINSHTIVTAAHCVTDDPPDHEFYGGAEVDYFDPLLTAGQTRRVTNPNGWELVGVFVHPDYSGLFDYKDDVAVVRKPSGWLNTGNSDYQRISLGSCSQIDRMTFYGRGANHDSETGGGILRSMPINLKDCFSDYFYDLEGTRAVCLGDSGGPYIARPGQVDVVAGILTLHYADKGDACTASAEKQLAARLSDKLTWIEDKMDQTCDRSSFDGHPFAQCW